MTNAQIQMIGIDDASFFAATNSERIEWAKANTTIKDGLCEAAAAWIFSHPGDMYSSEIPRICSDYQDRDVRFYLLPPKTRNVYCDKMTWHIAKGRKAPSNQWLQIGKLSYDYLTTKPDENASVKLVEPGDIIFDMHQHIWALAYKGCPQIGTLRWVKDKEDCKWWFNIESKLVKHTTHRDLGYGKNWIEVDLVYAHYLSNRPDGEWELRFPKESEIIWSTSNNHKEIPASFLTCFDSGPSDRGYRWCKIISSTKGQYVEYDVKAINCRKSFQYCLMKGDMVLCSLDKAIRTLDFGAFGGVQFKGQTVMAWSMSPYLLITYDGNLTSMSGYEKDVPAIPIKARFWQESNSERF